MSDSIIDKHTQSSGGFEVGLFEIHSLPPSPVKNVQNVAPNVPLTQVFRKV